MREQQSEHYKGIFIPIREKLSNDEGSISEKALKWTIVTAGIGAAAIFAWNKVTGGIDLWTDKEVTSKPAVVIDVFELNETCFAGYDADTATTAKAQGHIRVDIPFSDKTINEPIPTAWRSQAVSGITEVKICQESTTVDYTYNTQTGVMDVEVPYSSLSFEADMPVEQRVITPDGGLFNEISENSLNTLSIFTDGGPVADSHLMDSGLAGLAEAQNIENTVTSCSDEVWDRFAKEQFVEGNIETITAAAEALDVDAPETVNVTFVGEALNPHSQYQGYLAEVADNEELSIDEDSIGECTIQPGVIAES